MLLNKRGEICLTTEEQDWFCFINDKNECIELIIKASKQL